MPAPRPLPDYQVSGCVGALLCAVVAMALWVAVVAGCLRWVE